MEINRVAVIRSQADQWVERRGVPRADVDPPVEAVASVVSDKAASAADPLLSAVGRAHRAEEATKKAKATVDAHEAETDTRWLPHLQQLIDDTVRGPAIEIASHEQSLIANWFMALPRERQVSEYFAAIAADDHKTVAVIERLPSALSPLDEHVRAKARDRKLQRAPAAKLEAIEALKNRIAARQTLAGSARRLLTEGNTGGPTAHAATLL